MSFSLGPTSLSKLRGVHPLLVAVVCRAIRLSTVDFTVYEGLRNLERQRELFASGASKTMNSRHLVGCAVDLPAWVFGMPKWDVVLLRSVKDAMFAAAVEMGVTLRWGGDWSGDGDQRDDLKGIRRARPDETFRDDVHFELPEKLYGSWAA